MDPDGVDHDPTIKKKSNPDPDPAVKIKPDPAPNLENNLGSNLIPI